MGIKLFSVSSGSLSILVMSRGRFILGAGVGWKEEEFTASGVPFERRGEVTDECLQIMQQAWEGGEISFHGKFYKLSGVGMHLRPTQKPRPPVWVGGNRRLAAARAARFGDYWIPTDYTVQEYEKNIGVYKEACARFSTSLDRVNVASHLMLIIDKDKVAADAVAKQAGESMHYSPKEVKEWAIVGDPAEVVRRIEAYNAVGVNYHVFNFASKVHDDAGIELFARDILPSFN